MQVGRCLPGALLDDLCSGCDLSAHRPRHFLCLTQDREQEKAAENGETGRHHSVYGPEDLVAQERGSANALEHL